MSNQQDATGRITSGIAPDTSVRRTLQFVFDQLPAWRDMPSRPNDEAEEKLNSQLCKFLNLAARALDFSMACFHHEEGQIGRRRVDISAVSPQSLIEGRLYFNLEPFLVLECKKLPAPTTDREREYVTGTDTLSGGIQRFKLGLHGATLRHAGIIGYLQEGSPAMWLDRINGWLDELAASSDSLWDLDGRLIDFMYDTANGTSRCESIHVRRDGISSQLQLTHLWIDMQQR